jgi:hypothetical protein
MRPRYGRVMSTHTLAELGVTPSEDSEPGLLEWRFCIEGPVMLMSSPTGMDGRGFRYVIGHWGERVIAANLVKLYASGGKQGVIFLAYKGDDLRAAVERVNAVIGDAPQSENFASGFQPPGFRPLDVEGTVAAAERGEYVAGPGWDELDAAAIRGYGGTAPANWASPGEPCVMRFRRKP